MNDDINNSQKNNNVTKTIRFKRSSLSEKINEDSSTNKKNVTKTVRFKKGNINKSLKKDDEAEKKSTTKTVRFKRDSVIQKTGSVSSVSTADKSQSIKDAPKTVRLKPKRNIGNKVLKSSGSSEKKAISKDAMVLNSDLSEKNNTLKEASGAAAKTIEKTLKLKRPASSMSSSSSSSAKTDKTFKSSNIEKTLKLKRQVSSRSNPGITDKFDGNDEIKKTIGLKKPTDIDSGLPAQKRDEKKVTVEKTLKLKKPNVTKVLQAKTEENKIEKTAGVSIEKTLKLKRPGLSNAKSESKEISTAGVSVEKTLKLKRPGLSGEKTETKEGSSSEVSVEKTLKLRRPVSSSKVAPSESTKTLKDDGVEKTLKLKRPGIAANTDLKPKVDENKAAIEVSDNNVSLKVDAEGQEEIFSKDSSPKLKLKTSNINNNQLDRKTVLLKSESPIKTNKSTDISPENKGLNTGKASNNIKIPPLPIKKDVESNIDKDTTGVLADELNLELEAALDALSIDDVKEVSDKPHDNLKKVGKTEEEIEDIENIDKLEEMAELEEESSEKDKKTNYSFTYVAVSLLTLIGLICFLYVSFQSLKLF